VQNAKMKRRITRLAMAAAWIAVIAIAYATLTHVGFVYAIYFKLSPFLMRPAMQTFAHFEHVIAFAILGALFGFAYPRRLILVCCIVFGAAALLEILQTMTPDRHATLIDALEKMVGGAAGIIFARTVRRLWPTKDRPSQDQRPLI
jgi:VanZ family protein